MIWALLGRRLARPSLPLLPKLSTVRQALTLPIIPISPRCVKLSYCRPSLPIIVIHVQNLTTSTIVGYTRSCSSAYRRHTFSSVSTFSFNFLDTAPTPEPSANASRAPRPTPVRAPTVGRGQSRHAPSPLRLLFVAARRRAVVHHFRSFQRTQTIVSNFHLIPPFVSFPKLIISYSFFF